MLAAMRAAEKNLPDKLLKAISRKGLHAGKFLYRVLRAPGASQASRVLFIFGCQRSGTTLIQELFDRDFDARVYPEFDSRVYGRATERQGREAARHFRLKPLEQVRKGLARERARLVVVKPIVETQNARELLAFFPQAKGLFVYRHYAAVAASDLKRFGMRNGIDNLRPLVNGESANWRAQGVASEVRAEIQARFHERMDPYDAAALFWYARNRFFFDLGLERHAAVKPLKYEGLVQEPSAAMEGIYRFVGLRCPPAVAALVHGESSGNGRHVKLSAGVERLCDALLQRLELASAQAWKVEGRDARFP
jgi:hypothetical protein